jgi:hypothetical protein
MNDHAFQIYIRGVLRTPPQHRDLVLARLREHDRNELAEAALQYWLVCDDTPQPENGSLDERA